MTRFFTDLSAMEIALWIAGLLAVLWLVRYVIVVRDLLGHVMRRSSYRLVDSEQVPAHVIEGLREPLQRLADLGFIQVGWMAVQRVFTFEQDVIFAALLRSSDGLSYADISFSDLPEPLDPHKISFTSILADGRQLLTMNGMWHRFVGGLPATVEVADPYAETVEAQWQVHQQRLQGTSLTGIRVLEPDAYIAEANHGAGGYVEMMVHGGHLLSGPQPETWRFNLRTALAGGMRILRGIAPKRRMLVARMLAFRKAGAEPPQLPIEEEVRAFNDYQSLRRSTSRRGLVVAVFAVTLVLFALAAIPLVGADMVVALVLTVVVHELGHLLVMRLLGYQDTSIFFIPFVGAAATGQKRDATISQEMLVLLAGPVPGLLLAGVLAVAWPGVMPAGLPMMLFTAAALNYFNLLPIFPLDGGRVVHRLLLDRNRWADSLVKLLAGGAFAAIGVLSSSTLLIVLGFLVLVSIPAGFQLNTARMRLDEMMAAASQPVASELPFIFQVLRHGNHGPGAFAKKVAMARALLQRSGSGQNPGCLVIGLWLLTYLGTLLGGVVVLLVIAVGIGFGSQGSGSEEMPLPVVGGVAYPCGEGQPLWQGWTAQRLAEPLPVPQWAPVVVGIFADPAGAEAAVAAVSAALTGSEVAGDGLAPGEPMPALVSRTGSLLSVMLVGEDLDEEHPDLTAVIDLLHEHGAVEVMPVDSEDEETWIWLQTACQARSEQEAVQIQEELERYLPLGFSYSLRPPWLPAPELGEEERAQQQRARYTYRQLDAASWPAGEGRMRVRDVVRGLLWQFREPDLEELEREAREAQAESQRLRRRRVEAALAEVAPGELDDGMVELYLQTLELDAMDEEQQWQLHRSLGQRMGQLELIEDGERVPQAVAAQDAFIAYPATVHREGGHLVFSGLSFKQPATGLPAFLSWLCATGCTDIHIEVQTYRDTVD